MKTAVRVLVTHSAAEEEFFWKKIYWHSYSSNVFLSNFDPVTVWFLFGSKKKNTKKGNLLSNGDTFWSSVEMIVSTICVKCTCTQHEGK